MERRLATIQRVSALSPIEGADKIEVARVLGWDCVVKKGEFKEGDLGVYIEVDSVLPDKPVFAFMEERKFRVKTVKLRGQISQGLFLSVASFPEIKKPKEDMDVTKLLGIVKYDPPEVDYNPSKSSKAKKHPWWFYILVRIPFLRKRFIKSVGGGIAFPTHLVPKTDETRVQAFGDSFLEAHKDLKVNVTQKMDGTSVTIIWHKNKLSVASRNVWFPTYKANVYWDFVKQVGFEKFLKKGTSLAIQGELCGPGIQGNKYKLSEVRLFIFGAYDISIQEYMNPKQLRELTNYIELFSDTPHVYPVETLLDDKPISAVGTTVDEWMQFATTRSSYNPETWNEGIVVRSMDNKPYGVKGMNGRRWSFKVVSSEFLLQYGL